MGGTLSISIHHLHYKINFKKVYLQLLFHCYPKFILLLNDVPNKKVVALPTNGMTLMIFT